MESLDTIHKIHQILLDHPDLSHRFYQKWGVTSDQFLDKITNSNTHGGLVSKEISLRNLTITPHQTILDIGPEMGLEVFLLNELCQNITVCDPDEENLRLIRDLCKYYKSTIGSLAINQTKFLPLGFNNTSQFSAIERQRHHLINEKLHHSLPTFYNVTSTESISNLKEKFDIIFIHKILTTITRNDNNNLEIFSTAIQNASRLLSEAGLLSWTEPLFVFEQKEIIKNKSLLVDIGHSISIEYYSSPELPETYVQLIIEN